jgi:WD40 repeat protein
MSAAGGRLTQRAQFAVPGYPIDASWSSDGTRLVIALGEGGVMLVDLQAAEPVPSEVGRHASGALAVSWQPGGSLFASSGEDGRVLLWDAHTRNPLELLRRNDWTEHLAFSPDGKWLAAAVQQELVIFDAEGVERTHFRNHPGVINAIAWRPRPMQIAALSQGGARVHTIEPMPESLELDWNGACLTASWSPDGRLLASGLREGALHYWNLAQQGQSEMRGYPGKVVLTSFSANSRHLATATGELIVVWDMGGDGPEGSVPLQLQGHSDRITQLGFSPRGSLLVSGARDRRVLLWQLGSGNTSLDADLLSEEVVLLRWSRDGAWLLAGDRAGNMRLYTLGTGP